MKKREAGFPVPVPPIMLQLLIEIQLVSICRKDKLSHFMYRFIYKSKTMCESGESVSVFWYTFLFK